MWLGIVERHIVEEVPFQAELRINFIRDGEPFVQARLVNTNSGGVYFYVPFETELPSPGEEVSFEFDLPFHGKTTLIGTLQKTRVGLDNYQNRICYYDAKFSNLSRDVWNDLVDYIQHQQTPATGSKLKPAPRSVPVQRVDENRRDYRVKVADIKVELKPVKGKLIRGVLDDLSIGGASAIIPQALPVGTKTTFRIRRKAFELFLNAEVARMENAQGGGYRVGLRFENLEKAEIERLSKMVHQLANVGTESEKDA